MPVDDHCGAEMLLNLSHGRVGDVFDQILRRHKAGEWIMASPAAAPGWRLLPCIDNLVGKS